MGHTLEFEVLQCEFDGGKAAAYVPVIPEDWGSPRLKNALAARRACYTEGRCTLCGAEVTARRGTFVIEHEAWCDVGDRRIQKLLRRSNGELPREET